MPRLCAIPLTSRLSVPMKAKVQPCFFIFSMIDHLVVVLHRGVFLAIGDDGHDHFVIDTAHSVDLGDALAHSVIEGRAATGAILAGAQNVGLLGGNVVEVVAALASLEGHEGDALLNLGIFLLQLLHGLDGFVHTGKGLLFDEAHTSAFVYDNQVINSLHGVSFFRILDFVVSLSMLLSIIRNEKGKN